MQQTEWICEVQGPKNEDTYKTRVCFIKLSEPLQQVAKLRQDRTAPHTILYDSVKWEYSMRHPDCVCLVCCSSLCDSYDHVKAKVYMIL